MYVLGIEASTPVAATAVATEGKILAERMVNNKRTHSVNLLPMVRDVLADAGIDKNKLDGIAVTTGPGSFTGLRIGMSTAKTLAMVLNLPVAGVPTLESLAYPLSGQAGLICPVLNARKNELYVALYRSNGKKLVTLLPAFAAGVKALASILETYDEHITFLGDGLEAYQSELTELLKDQARFAPECAVFPRGAAVAELGLQLIKSGAGTDPMTLLPHYIRESEAEIKWRERCLPNG
ncbi:MAG TPA: tRNA (adenosine(37)-N6)-threonylcarbamoyltransferase complex dimerization subunit type 1 TsaB [Desulfotomaculum sp.]|nr:MAG: peptidase M22 [Peptococcaceae bacterium BRH_c8a]KJS77653.1 MAG: peptidase M22 [Desulfotomaculum sp. BICA1-6]HBX22598.1 tRNA (adenosine(37)-N6)-threonylcarbamoyltransferase complex dimerization subunit type 1 TsaB [Desulfotomaculum sp.]